MKAIVLLILFKIFCTASFGSEIKSNPPNYDKLEIFSEALGYIENYYFDKIDREKLIYSAIKGMLNSLDPHSVFFEQEMFDELKVSTQGIFNGLGIEISLINGIATVISPIQDSPAFKAGIMAGDKIIMIEDIDIKNKSLTEIMELMKEKKDGSLKLTILREGIHDPFTFSLKREIIIMKSVEMKIFDKIGYIKIKSFQENTYNELNEKYEKIKSLLPDITGLIIDVRDNPGGLFDQSVLIADRFLENGRIVSTIGRDTKVIEIREAIKDNGDIKIPVSLLINKGTASASEILAGALKDNNRALIIGETSFGKGSVQTIIEMKDLSGIKLTIANYYTPSGKSISKIGIVPDILIKQRECKEVVYSNGEIVKDYQLIQAINHLNSFRILLGKK